jgi:hypothetical protein
MVLIISVEIYLSFVFLLMSTKLHKLIDCFTQIDELFKWIKVLLYDIVSGATRKRRDFVSNPFLSFPRRIGSLFDETRNRGRPEKRSRHSGLLDPNSTRKRRHTKQLRAHRKILASGKHGN